MGTPLPQRIAFTPSQIRLTSPVDILTRAGPYLVQNGQWTPYRAFAQFFNTAEFRTRFSKTIAIDIANLEDPTPNPVLNFLKPAIILRGPVGTATIAPYGEVPSENEALWNMIGVGVGIAVTFMTIGFVWGSTRQKIKQKRRERGESGTLITRRIRRRLAT